MYMYAPAALRQHRCGSASSPLALQGSTSHSSLICGLITLAAVTLVSWLSPVFYCVSTEHSLQAVLDQVLLHVICAAGAVVQSVYSHSGPTLSVACTHIRGLRSARSVAFAGLGYCSGESSHQPTRRALHLHPTQTTSSQQRLAFLADY
jgi:hypothetical protein